MTPIAESDHETTTYRLDLGMAYRLLAQAFAGMGDKKKALEMIEKAIPIALQLKNENALRDSDANLIAEMESERAAYSK